MNNEEVVTSEDIAVEEACHVNDLAEGYVECHHCHEKIRETDAWTDDDGYCVCPECREELYRKCDDCGKEVLKDMMDNKGNKFFCEDCTDEWAECYECGEAVSNDDAFITNDGEHICRSCYDRHYFTCDDCGVIFHDDEGYWHGDYHYCESCYNNNREDEESDRSGVLEYHGFAKRKYLPRKLTNEKTNLFFGVELECDGGSFDIDDFDWWVNDHDNLVHFENDGSLSDDGVECITMPCSLGYHRFRMDWAGLCKALLNEGYCSHDTSSCGLHVHISRDALTPIQIMKMDVFVNRGADFFSQIARRTDFYSSEYNKDKLVDKHKGEWSGCDSHNARYTAVNTCNEKTVEIRIFKGTLRPETILGTIEMCHALVGFLDTVPIVHIYDTNKNIANFIKYLADHHEEYPDVFPMMRRLVKWGWNKMIGKYYGEFCSAVRDRSSEQ